MALTKNDLKQIGQVVVEVTAPMFEQVYERFDSVETNLNTKIDSVEKSLTTRVDKFEHETHHYLSGIEQRLDTIESKLDGLDEDIRSLYKLVDQLKKSQGNDKKFLKLDVEQKILRLHADLLSTAKQAGVSLPK